MTDQDKVIYIELRFASGKVLKAEGEHATEAWEYITWAQSLAFIHGARYEGKPMVEVERGGKK